MQGSTSTVIDILSTSVDDITHGKDYIGLEDPVVPPNQAHVYFKEYSSLDLEDKVSTKGGGIVMSMSHASKNKLVKDEDTWKQMLSSQVYTRKETHVEGNCNERLKG
ncbi:uncharacterized protein G2W53_017831 [Senna tora]|uniref:Uncharacterized protein n=1 Tax=Senna tora TaxID=362788 RepID=A0A834TRL9_9FABA|nr:uncharacterized protein G2W53_017831 [Senna tora]